MVWPFSSSDSNNETKEKPIDPYSKLDPSLRKFLERESPGNYEPTKAPERQPTAREKVNLVAKPDTSSDTPSTATPTRPLPPTLYPDGRYADLWKTYRSQAEVESEGKSDQEKLDNVIQLFQDQRKQVSKAALENCAEINATLDQCFRKPTMAQRVVMCRTETRALNRCLDMNKRFLKALGYLSVDGRSQAEEEAIQMHADRLYTRMLEHEKKMEEAKTEGKELPAESFFKDNKEEVTSIFANLTPEGRKKLEERTKDLSPAEKEIEERAFAAELKAGMKTLEKVEKHRLEVREARLERIEAGKGSLYDKLQAYLGF